MRVRITKCDNEDSWYYGMEGSIHEVVESDVCAFEIYCIEPETENGHYIYKADAEVVPDPTPSEEMMDRMIDVMPSDIAHGCWRNEIKAAWRRLFDSETSLLPCPFCGSEAKLCGPGGEDKQFSVVCQHSGCGCNARILYCDTRENAIEQWNRRKNEQ